MYVQAPLPGQCTHCSRIRGLAGSGTSDDSLFPVSAADLAAPTDPATNAAPSGDSSSTIFGVLAIAALGGLAYMLVKVRSK